MKKILAAFLVIMYLFSSHAQAADKNILDWQKAIGYLDQYNNTLLNMNENTATARKQYSYALMNAESIDVKGMTITVMGREMYIDFDDRMEMAMVQRKELYPEQVKLNWEMSRDLYTITRNRMIVGLRGLYFSLYSAMKDQDIKTRKLELQESIHNQNVLRYGKGMISGIGLEESEYSLLAAKAAADASARNLENMMRSFNAYVGIEPGTVFDEVILNEKFDESRLRKLEFYLERAPARRYDITVKRKQLALMEKQKEIMERYPLNMNTVSIRREYEELSGEIDDLKTLIEIERLNIEKGIREAYIEVVNAGKKVKEMEQLVDLQKSSLEKINARYERGLVPKTVADQAQLSCEELELGYLAALIDYNTKLMKLENAAGIGPAYQEG